MKADADIRPYSTVTLPVICIFLLHGLLAANPLPANERPNNLATDITLSSCKKNAPADCAKSNQNSTLSSQKTLANKSPQSSADENALFLLLDSSSHFVADGINGFSRRIDEFFAAEKVYYDSNGSYIRLTTDSVWYQREESGFTAGIRLKLNLPRSKDKYKFTFESNPNQQSDSAENNAQKSPLDVANEQNYFAGFQAIARATKNWRIRAGIGIKLRSPLESYFRLNTRGIYSFLHWSLRLDETLYWYDQAGKSFITSIELNRHIVDSLLFRSASRAHWTETDNFFTNSQIFSLFQTLDDNNLISFNAGAYGLTEPVTQATDYRVSINFRHNLRNQYLFIELIPQIRYQKINKFSAEYGFILRIEWLFQS